MPAMTMPFELRQADGTARLVPGALVEFTLVVGDADRYARGGAVRRYQTAEQDPRTARRLAVDEADGRSADDRRWRSARPFPTSR